MRRHTTLSRAYTGSILRAGNGDADLARQAVAEVHGRTPVDSDNISDFLHNPAHYLILALNGGQVVGSLMGYRLQYPQRSEPQFLLYEIDVRTECRNRGIGRALVAQFIREAKDAGAFEVWVLTSRSNKAAMKMYTYCGLRLQQDDDVMLSLMLK